MGIKKISDEKYLEFWKEYSTNIKLGVIEDTNNRTRLAKLLRFASSAGSPTSLAEYVERMKDKQESIFYIAGGSKEEVEKSPFVGRLIKKFQNVAKEGFNIDGDTDAAKERRAALDEKFDPLMKWLGEDALKDHILNAKVSERLENEPAALITSK